MVSMNDSVDGGFIVDNSAEQRIQELKEELQRLESEQQQKQEQAIQQEQETQQEQLKQEQENRLRARLNELIEISKDPYYDAYLAQLMKDLNSKKATCEQIEREAERTYRLYQQRMMNQGKPVQSSQVPTTNSAQYVNTVKQPKNNMEFKIGAGVLSAVGVVFLLIAFITFGLNFLNGMVQGICLYGASILVLLVSELVLWKKIPRFSVGITALGICSLYVSTIINYFYLKTMNGIVAIAITVVIALAAILLSKKRDSGMIRLISIIGCYICFFPIEGFQSELEFLILTVILFIINIGGTFLPVRKNQNVISLIHMGFNTLFTILFSVAGMAFEVEAIYVVLYVMTTVIALHTVYWKLERKVLNTVLYCVELALCGFVLTSVIGDANFWNNIPELLLSYRIIALLLMAAISGFFFILNAHCPEKWIQYYFFMGVTILLSWTSYYDLEVIICIVILFIIAKIASSVKEMEVANAIITFIAAAAGIAYLDNWYGYMIVALMFIGIFFIRKLPFYYEYLTTIFFMIYAMLKLELNWAYLACVITLLLTMFLFNQLPWMKKRNQLPFNIGNLVLTVLTYLAMILCNSTILCSVMLVLGVGYILLFLRPNYGFKAAPREVILGIYLTYMIFICRFGSPILTSILLMLVAAFCVGIGFFTKNKGLRICGLVMSLLICFKMVLFEFRALESLSKIILFVVVGMIALGISFVYILLEKKEQKEKRLDTEQQKNDVNQIV